MEAPSQFLAENGDGDMGTGLSEEQCAAVLAPEGPVRVVAGPGSGKTRVLALRVAHLVKNENLAPWSALCITFTRKAAGELKERLAAFLGAERARRVWAGTFHAVCARILRHEVENRLPESGRTASFAIFGPDEQLDIMRGVLETDMYEPSSMSAGTARKILGQLGRARAAGALPATVHQSSPGESALRALRASGEYVLADEQPRFVEAVDRYERALIAANAFDFDQLITWVAELFRTDESALSAYRRRWPHILVDEFQDTNSPQYAIVARLAGARSFGGVRADHSGDDAPRASSLFVVGDADQAIYGWRGADVANMRSRLAQDFPEMAEFKLSANYRSTPQVVRAAAGVLQRKSELDVLAHRPSGTPVHVGEFDDADEEARAVAGEANWLMEHAGVPFGSMAVLYRTNRQAREIESALAMHGVPYAVVGGTAFFQRKEVKDALAYLRLAANPSDVSSFDRVANVPPRGLGPKALEALAAVAEERGTSVASLVLGVGSSDAAWEAKGELAEAVGTRPARGVRDFRALVRAVSDAADAGTDAGDVVQLAIDLAGFEKWLLPQKDTAKGKRMSEAKWKEQRQRWGNLTELVEVARGVGTEALEDDETALAALGAAPEGANTLSSFLDRVAMYGDAVSSADGEDAPERVQLMTLHTAKGLEFDAVFLVGVEEALLPIAMPGKSLTPERFEEESRLCYVGMTRARHRLYLSHARSRQSFGRSSSCLPSPFLASALSNLREVRGPSTHPPWRLYA